MKNYVLLSAVLLLSTLMLHAQKVELQSFAEGFNRPTDIQSTRIAEDSRLFVVEQVGRIQIINESKEVNATPFLDISTRVFSNNGGEVGLLGLVFHPNYASNGRFYVNYTGKRNTGQTATYISEFSITDFNTADPDSEKVLLTYDQPASNHNGGALQFRDGMLYVASGDGGGGNDTYNNGQNINTPLGAILRLDVDNESNAYIPSDNPFVGRDGNDYIWAYGLRNPWRFSFDSMTKDLWIADVGDGGNGLEEVNKIVYTTNPTVQNYGWPCFEGTDQNTRQNSNPACAENPEVTFPVTTYSRRNERCSITGGYVYRGTNFPNLQGKYLYSDFCTGEIFSVNASDGENFKVENTNGFTINVSTFGERSDRELFVAGYNDGVIYQLVDANTLSVTSFESSGIILSQDYTRQLLRIDSQNSITFKNLEIYNLAGQRIADLLTRQLNPAEFDLRGLAPGLVILTGEDSSGISFSSKLLLL